MNTTVYFVQLAEGAVFVVSPGGTFCYAALLGLLLGLVASLPLLLALSIHLLASADQTDARDEDKP